MAAGAVVVGSNRLERTGPTLDPPADIVDEETSRAEPVAWHGLAPDERAVAIVPPAAPLPLDVGDRVELVAVAARADGTIHSYVIGPAVRVLTISPDSIVVVVPAELAPLVIDYQASGTIELVAAP